MTLHQTKLEEHSWLFTGEALQRCASLVGILKSKRLQLVDGPSSRRHYSPWHSLAHLDRSTKPLISEFETLALKHYGLLTDETFLKSLAEHLRVGFHNFGLIKRDERFECQIDINAQESAGSYNELLASSLSLIEKTDLALFNVLLQTIDCFVPITYAPDGVLKKRALTSTHTFGCLFITFVGREPAYERAEFAMDISHELGHHLLMAYQMCDPLLQGPTNIMVYSGVRKTLRPALLSFHAACAMAFMIRTLNAIALSQLTTERELEFAHSKSEQWKVALTDTIDSLEKRCHFTDLGREILNEFKRVVN